jgi:transcriptional regulator with XRE-family HTH domain
MKIKDINVCSRLGEERKRLNVNQNKIADYCGVSIKTVGRWEKNIPIPADKLSLLAQLGYDITYILTGVKLVPQVAGLDVASDLWNTKGDSEAIKQEITTVSKEQKIWLDILENLAGSNSERIKLLGLALVGYSQSREKKAP